MNLTPGDVDHDGRTDLLVDGYETDSQEGWNANFYLPGSASGVTRTGSQKLPAGILSDVGDVNGDGLADLAVGAPGEDLDGVADTGMVTVLYGSRSGFAATGAQSFAQDTPGVPGGNEKGDGFGGEVYLTDTNDDGKADLTVGIPWENASDGSVVTFNSDGAKLVPTGRSYGLTATKISATGTPQLGSDMTN